MENFVNSAHPVIKLDIPSLESDTTKMRSDIVCQKGKNNK